MSINRNNYEEYFLLYADNELSADDRNSVEVFVKLNSDLEEEFIMLQQSVLKPDNIILEEKDFLFKDGKFINRSNYEEKFILYNDNELNDTEREETENFLQANLSFRDDFELFARAKYRSDKTIIFPGKDLLYKEKGGRAIPLYWRRAIAAAILLGIGLWTGIGYFQKSRTYQPVAVTQPVITHTEIKLPPVAKLPLKNVAVVNSSPARSAERRIDKPVKEKTVQRGVAIKIPEPEKRIPEQVIKSPDLTKETATIEALTTNPPLAKFNKVEVKSNNLSEPVDRDLTPVTQSKFARTASYAAEPEEKSGNYVFYNVTEEQFKKSKLGIFLKKVKRVIERKNPLRESSPGE